MPPAPCTGSAMKAATVSGPSCTIVSSSIRAAACPTVSPGRAPSKRYAYGVAVWMKLGTRGPNILSYPGTPVALMAAMVTPW